MKTFYIIRHPAVDKKDPLGEAAPLSNDGEKQAEMLTRVFRIIGVGLVVVPAEDLPRFTQTAAEIEYVGITVHRAKGISFKDMKGKTQLRELLATYRVAGLRLITTLLGPGTPDKICIIGSYPLVAGLRLDLATASDDELNAKPDFCTGIVVEVDEVGQQRVTEHDYRPADEDLV